VILAVSGTAAEATTDGLNGRIAFERQVGGLSDLYVVDNPAGVSGTQQPEPATPPMPASREGDPTWAPPQDSGDGTPIPAALAFETDAGDGDMEIFYWIEGSIGGPEPLTGDPADDTDPAWAPDWPEIGAGASPNGERPPLAFVRNGDLFVSSFDGTVVSNLTNSAGQEANPDWSPDGEHLTFELAANGRREIAVVRVGYEPGPPPAYRASDLRIVTPGQPPSFTPSWFFYPMLPDDLPPPSSGGGEGPGGPPVPAECTEPDPPEQDCAYAPADRIAFAGPDADGGMEIFFATYEELDFNRPFADPNRTTHWAVTENSAEDSAPAWSPLGDMLVFERIVAGQPRLHVMEQDGEGDRALDIQTVAGAGDRNPAWEPLLNEADVSTRRPCGRYSTRPRCKRAARIASVCRPGDPPPCVQPCPDGTAPPCKEPPPPCADGTPPPCKEPPPECTRSGGPERNVIRGTAASEVLCGGGGNDVLLGRGGNDVLRGGGGRDLLRGGAGNDRLEGGRGGDRLLGEAGADRLSGGPGGDFLVGGPGRDRLLGEAGSDRIDARDRRRDRVSGGAGMDTATLGGPADRLRGIERSLRP
jgi:hemolysin type calcium-binding protein/WD40 repeat protein